MSDQLRCEIRNGPITNGQKRESPIIWLQPAVEAEHSVPGAVGVEQGDAVGQCQIRAVEVGFLDPADQIRFGNLLALLRRPIVAHCVRVGGELLIKRRRAFRIFLDNAVAT